MIHQRRRRRSSLPVALIPLLLAAAPASSPALRASLPPASAPAFGGRVLHVSPDGDDAADGSEARPLRTLEAARDRIRELRAAGVLDGIDGGATVLLAEGTWELRRTFRLEARDSGAPEAPVVYRAASPGKARLAGGRRVSFGRGVSDPAVRERLAERARTAVLEADLLAQGIEDFGRLMPRGFGGRGGAALELFFDRKPMPLARYPNRGWLTIAGLPGGKDGDRIRYAGDRPARWTKAEDPWLFGYWYHGWADQFLPVAGIDAEKREMRLGARHGYGLREGQRYFALNLLEELDEPGEWYLDRARGKLYFWPPEPIDDGNDGGTGGAGPTVGAADAIVSILDGPLVEVDGASHLALEGLVLEATRGTAVVVSGGEGIAVLRCAIRNVGAWGVRVSGGRRHRVESCDVAHTGEGGVSLRGGDRKTLERGEHECLDTHIRHFGRTRRTYQPAVELGGVGLRAAHNLIHESPHMALGFGGNDHLIELNEIHHVLTETDDAGAMYIGRDWTTRGHVIRHNWVHHSGSRHALAIPEEERTEPHVVYEPLRVHGTNLLYFDDAACGIEVVGNVLHDGGRAVMIGGGRDHRVRNNLILGGEIGIWIDARGIGWAKDHIRRGGGWGMYRKLEDVGFDRPPYSERYPELRRILEENPHEPRGNSVGSNVLVGVKEWRHLQGAKEEWIDFARNMVLDVLDVLDGPRRKPGDPAKAADRADPADPAAALRSIPRERLEEAGFQPIPLERIGLRRKDDELMNW